MGKKGPPYDDDPECKYIVIEDPFPGHKTGKARDKAYWDWLGGWIYYMTGKKEDATAVYFVHTRDEVIVQLSEDFDITPILGEHAWRDVLAWGDPKFRNRVSYIFEYNYRIRGHPGNHGWEEEWPTGGDPNNPRQFPVKFPYPRPHWATPRGKNCADLALPLPRSRARTPTPPPLPPQPTAPEPSLFEPYEAPAHHPQARDAHINEAREQDAEPAKMPIPDRLLVDKRDPYEEEDAALRFVKQEPIEDLHIKEEVDVKQETFEPRMRREHDGQDSEHQPSKEFMEAFNRLETARNGRELAAKREPSPPSQPSQAFMAAFERLEQARGTNGRSTGQPLVHDHPSPDAALTPDHARSVTAATPPSERARSETWTPGIRVKPEPQEDTLPLPPPPPAQPTRDPRLAKRDVRVKPEREEPTLPAPPPSRPQPIRVKPEPEDRRMPPPTSVRPDDTRTQDPRQRGKLPSFKRVKREEDGGSAKRPRTD